MFKQENVHVIYRYTPKTVGVKLLCQDIILNLLVKRRIDECLSPEISIFSCFVRLVIV